MIIEAQPTPELKHIAELIEDIAISMLTTVESDGSLASRPMYALEMDASGAIWFFTDRRSSKVGHLGVVNLAFTDLDESCYVSLSGHGEIVGDRGSYRTAVVAVCAPLVSRRSGFAESRVAEVRAALGRLLGRAQQQDGAGREQSGVHRGRQAHRHG